VFLNLASQRVSEVEPQCPGDDPALRVTLAHELCHLLLDGGHAVTAVDVLKSRMPVAIEQRAKSFAGELLLPSRTAARWWQDMGGPINREGLRGVLLELESTFRVPRAVSTWKLDHGLQSLGRNLSNRLATLSRYR
jgi:Zn-dependent peptidase ImmA (M78 family)